MQFVVRGGLAVAWWTAKREVRGSNLGQGRHLDRDFCSMGTLLRFWENKSVDTEASLTPGTTRLERGIEG